MHDASACPRQRWPPTLDVEAYEAASAAVRDAIGDKLILQATSEAVGMYQPAEQMAMVRGLRPEAVSMAIRELVPDDASERDAAEFFAWLGRENISPQYILYSEDEVRRFMDLRRRSVIPGESRVRPLCVGPLQRGADFRARRSVAVFGRRRRRGHSLGVLRFRPARRGVCFDGDSAGRACQGRI